MVLAQISPICQLYSFKNYIGFGNSLVAIVCLVDQPSSPHPPGGIQSLISRTPSSASIAMFGRAIWRYLDTAQPIQELLCF